MPSPANGDPRRERAVNDELDAPDGRCLVCHAPHPPRPLNSWGYPIGRPRGPNATCGPRCRMYLWRRNGDPDGRLDYRRSDGRPSTH